MNNNVHFLRRDSRLPSLTSRCAPDRLYGSIMKIMSLGLLFLLLPSVALAHSDSTSVSHFSLTGFDGATFGNLELGVSHTTDVRQLLDSIGGLGPERENTVEFIVGTSTMHPPLLYTPPATMNQLYFEDDVLVMIVEGTPHNLPTTRLEFTARYPNARETHREPDWYELQTQVGECVWLIAVFSSGDDRLQSDGYAYVCRHGRTR